MPSSSCPTGVATGLRLAALLMTAVPVIGGLPALAADPPRGVASWRPAPRTITFPAATGTFESVLRRRLEAEARRQKLGPEMPLFVPPGDDQETFEPERGRRVERTILRALKGAIDERLEESARGSAGLAPLFRWIDSHDDGAQDPAGGAQVTARPDSATTVSGSSTPSSPAPRGVGDLALRFRLDAHPRLLLGARFGAVSGRIEVPVLDRELRLSLDRPVGGHGRASIRGGWSAERGDWADLALHFRF